MATLVTPGALSATAPDRARPRAVAAWLLVCCALVFAMVVVGGVTRLTHSGLSIVEWQPIVGTLPPLSDARVAADVRPSTGRRPSTGSSTTAWRSTSSRASSGGNTRTGCSAALIGVAFLRPVRCGSLARRRDPGRATRWKLAGIFVLGGLQGALGWYMVQERPRRRSARVAVPPHRASRRLRSLIFAAMFWTALSLLDAARRARCGARRSALRAGRCAVVALVCVMVRDRRLRRGHPGRLRLQHVPADERPRRAARDPVARALVAQFFWNMATVQFDHRIDRVAHRDRRAARCGGRVVARATRRRARASAAHLLLACSPSQIALGIATLLLVVPLPLAAAHQAGAVLVFAAALKSRTHCARRRSADAPCLDAVAPIGARWIIAGPSRIPRKPP